MSYACHPLSGKEPEAQSKCDVLTSILTSLRMVLSVFAGIAEFEHALMK